jgi:cytochrome b involved in lipid metabolism
MLEEVARDATEAFEDVGHSDEARELLGPMYVGDFVGEVRLVAHFFLFRVLWKRVTVLIPLVCMLRARLVEEAEEECNHQVWSSSR